MKLAVIAVGLLAAVLSAMTASAHLLITVDCCNGATPVDLSGIVVTATQVGGSEVETGTTDVNGFVQLSFINIGDFTVCVDTTTLPAGATLATPCQVGTVPLTPLANSLTFCLSGTICTGAPGLCWETGGGTLDKGKKGDNVWSFGGVIYP